MTPSLPTFFMASAMMVPMVESELAEMVPTWAIMSPETGLENFESAPPMTIAVLIALADDGFNSLVDAALEGHGVGTGGDGLDAFAIDGLREHGGGGGAVTGDVGGLGSDFANHLGAHVFERVAELDFLGDGDAVLGDGGRAELLLDDDVAALGAEGDLHCVGEHVDAAQNGLTRVFAVQNLLCHCFLLELLSASDGGVATCRTVSQSNQHIARR